MKVVIKITGKVFDVENIELIKELANIIRHRYELGDRVAVIVGGGSTARKYITIGEKLGINNSLLDMLGIKASRINALLLSYVLYDISWPSIPRNIDEFLYAWTSGKVVICGGFQPAQSTNAVAALIAEVIRADLMVNATVTDGVYNKDPRRFKDAKLLKVVNISELERLIRQEFLPGHYELMDPLALNIIKRSKINLVFVNAFKPNTIREVLEGNRDVGTWVVHK